MHSGEKILALGNVLGNISGKFVQHFSSAFLGIDWAGGGGSRREIYLRRSVRRLPGIPGPAHTGISTLPRPAAVIEKHANTPREASEKKSRGRIAQRNRSGKY